MSRTDESWSSKEFELKKVGLRRKLTPNNKQSLDALDIPFVTYNANKNLPCFSYDLVHRHCVNKNGFMTREYLESEACLKFGRWHEQCVDLHQKQYLIGKYWAQERLNSAEASHGYSPQDVL